MPLATVIPTILFIILGLFLFHTGAKYGLLKRSSLVPAEAVLLVAVDQKF